MTAKTFTAIIHKEDDWYVAECPEVGTASQGHTIEEAIANLKEATELYLEEFPVAGTLLLHQGPVDAPSGERINGRLQK